MSSVRKITPGRHLARRKRRGVPKVLRRPAREMAARLGWERIGVLPPEVRLYGADAGLSYRTPALVVWPEDTDEVAEIVRVCGRHDLPFTARGAGTGLSGGAVAPPGGVVVSLARMNRILDIDVENRSAWVQPGVVNLELSGTAAERGLQFAPDPSSQAVCTVGGNVAENSGGPHCLVYGATSPHVLAVEVVLPSGEVVMLGGEAGESLGYDLRGVFVGSEGMCGIATRICVRLVPRPPAVATLLGVFPDAISASRATSGVIAGGIVPGALELMDGPMCGAVAEFLGTDDYPRDGSSVLLAEVEGMPGSVAEEADRVERILREHGASEVRRARDDAERGRFWKGRKSAFGAVGRLASHYYLHDCVVPRTRLAEVLEGVYAIAERHTLQVVNVFHAGDGNLHPLLVFDGAEEGVMERVHAAGADIVELCVGVGGVLSGEHGIGLEKREYMPLLFGADDLDAQAKIPRAFDPDARSNSDKVFPQGSRCGDVRELPRETREAAASGLWV